MKNGFAWFFALLCVVFICYNIRCNGIIDQQNRDLALLQDKADKMEKAALTLSNELQETKAQLVFQSRVISVTNDSIGSEIKLPNYYSWEQIEEALDKTLDKFLPKLTLENNLPHNCWNITNPAIRLNQ